MSKDDVAPDLRTRIEGLIASKPIVLFMKGTKVLPHCGFSARVVNILNELGVDYQTVNVLADQELREGLKVFTDWPTYPQLYYNGAFIGGADIVSAMAEKGELTKMLKGEGA